MNNTRTALFFIVAFFLFIPTLHAQQKTTAKNLDRIVAVVNDHIVLKTEVDQQARQYMMQMKKEQDRDLSFGKDLWYTVLQNIVDRKLMLAMWPKSTWCHFFNIMSN